MSGPRISVGQSASSWREQVAVELDELVGQLVGKRLVRVPCRAQLVEFLGHVGVVILVGGVQQEQGGHLAGETVRIVACVVAAEGIADQQVGSRRGGGPQQLTQLAGDLGGGARQRARSLHPVPARS